MNDIINSIKPLFPATFDLEKYVKLDFKDNAELFTMLVKIGIYLLIGVIAGIILGVFGAIVSFLGLVWGLLGTLVSLYCFAGIVLTVLDFAKVFDSKDDNNAQ